MIKLKERHIDRFIYKNEMYAATMECIVYMYGRKEE